MKSKTTVGNGITVEVPGNILPNMGAWFLQNGDAVVKASANMGAEAVRQRAPRRTGELQRGLIVSPKRERTGDPLKVVYDIYPDPEKNGVFVKYTTSGKRYYYPASQEYGFRTRSARAFSRRKKAAKLARVPGKYFMKDGAVVNYGLHEEAVLQCIAEGLEQV